LSFRLVLSNTTQGNKFDTEPSLGLSLKQASKTLDRLLATKSVEVDAVIAEFKTARRRSSAPKKPVSAVKA